MLLDAGVCTIFRMLDNSGAGDMPSKAYTPVFRSWYGELSFETSPSRPTEGREERKTDARIRVLQNRTLCQGDVVVLADLSEFVDLADGTPVYRITRAYHGQDDGGPTPITDLTLEVYEP